MERHYCAISKRPDRAQSHSTGETVKQNCTAKFNGSVVPHESIKSKTEKMITRFVNNLKLSTRSCLMPFSSKYQLPSELDRFISTLNRARVVAIKIDSRQPTIERADKLAALMSEALSLARKFHGVKVSNDIYRNIDRVKRLLTPSVQMAKALVRAIEDTMSDESDDESEDGSDSEDELSDSESDSEDSSSEEESDSEEEDMLETPQKPLQADCGQKVTKTTQLKLMPTTLPRRPENCSTEMSRDLSELLWKTREEVERKQKKGLLNSTKRNSIQGFKNRGSQIQTQMRISFSKCSKKLTASNISSLMGDLVTPLNVRLAASEIPSISATMPSTHLTEPPKTKLITPDPPMSTQVQPVTSTEDLANTLDNIFPCVKYEISKLMSGITEKFSKSSISTVSSVTMNSDLDISYKELRDGPVKFLLYPSSLTKVLQQRKKKGQSLMILQGGQTAGDKKVLNPIKESILTSNVKDEDTVRYYANILARKIQQSLSHQAKAVIQVPSVRQAGRVILTAKRTKNLNTHLSSFQPANVTAHTKAMANDSGSGSSNYRLSLEYTASTGTDEPTTRAFLGKRSSMFVDLPTMKQIKTSI